MPSVQHTIIDSLRTALESAGFKVFNGIKGHHTGFRTRTRSYIEIAQTISRESNNITAECVSGPFTLRLKYYHHKQWVTNSKGQAQSLEDCLQLMEQAFSQVWEPGMYTPFDCRVVESIAGNNNSYYTEYELYGTLATLQDRGEIQGIPINTVAPVVSGTPREGETLTVAPGTWIGEPPIAYTYQWLNDGVDIAGETGLTYLIPAGILGDTISCNEIATNPFTPDLDPPYVKAESNGLVVTENIAPEFQTSPVISGTPQPDETLTAVNGTATGDPTPVITGEWYLDAVATGETGLTYTVPDSVGSDVTYLNTATNIEGVDTALSNSLEIVSGWFGIVDAYPGAELVFSNFVQQTPIIPVCNTIQVSAVPSDIGFSDNKFDGDAWDTATNFGANPAKDTDWYNQNTSNGDFVQTVGASQPEIDRDGALVPSTGAMRTPETYSLNANKKLQVFFNLRKTPETPDGTLLSHNSSDFRIYTTALGIRVRVNGLDTSTNAAVEDDQEHWFALILDGTDIIIEVDGVENVRNTTGYTFDLGASRFGLNTSSNNDTGLCDNKTKDLILYNGTDILSPSERTDIYNIWKVQNGIV